MAPLLLALSSSLFFVLGTLFFAALASFYGGGGIWAQWWLHVGDVPLLLTGGIAGSVALYQSLVGKRTSSFHTAFVCSAATLSFLFFAILNFWSILGS